MAIHFSWERKNALKDAYRGWWDGTLDRPLVRLTIADAHAPAHETDVPLLSQANCADFRWTPDQVIDAVDANLSRQEYLGDAFPLMDFTAFGPGVLAAMCGAVLDNSSGAVWFFPPDSKPIDQISIRYDPDNRWTQRIKALYLAGQKRWGGLVTLGMPDLGGVLDVVASFRGTEHLLTDLYDAPEEVDRLVLEAETAWHAAYDDFSQVLQQTGQGYSDWSGLWSNQPSYILQSDFCYMMGPEHFDRFVLPSLKRQLASLPDVIYHLDGIGQLIHLPKLLEIPELNAIQWVYGDGQPTAEHWLQVYHMIEQAGKRSWVIGSCEGFLEVSEYIKRGLYFNGHARKHQTDLIHRVLSAR